MLDIVTFFPKNHRTLT